MRARVTSRHPAKEFSIVDNEVGERELMRVEEEGSDTKADDGNPEIDNVRNPDAHGDVKQQHQCPHAEVDRRTSEPGAR